MEHQAEVILITGGYDHSLKLWDTHTASFVKSFQHPESQVNALAITPDRQIVASAGYQHIRFYEIHSPNANPIMTYDGAAKNVTAVGFQADGRWMFTGGEDSTARIWDLRTKNLQCQRLFQSPSAVNAVVLHPNQVELFIANQTGFVYVWDVRSNNYEQLLAENDTAIQSIAVDESSTQLAATSSSGTCYIWTLSGGRAPDEPTIIRERSEKPSFSAHKRYALKCTFSPDSTLLATTSADGTARVWRTADYSLQCEFRRDRWMWDCAFTLDSQFLVTANSDSNVYFWNVADKKLALTLNGHQKAVTAMAFKDDTTHEPS